MGVSVILNAAIAIVGPFFPPEAEKKGVELKTIGYIFSAYPMAFVIVSLIMPTILHYTNQRVVFVASSIIYALSVAGFGSIVFMEKDYLIIFGLIFRVLQGSSNAALYTTSYSIFSGHYEGGDFMKVNSMFKGTIGVGLLIGLLVGTLLYIAGGYFLPFLVYSGVMLLAVPFTAKLIPSRPLEDKGDGKYSDKSSDEDIEIGEDEKNNASTGEDFSEGQTSGSARIVKRKINPFKLVWHLLSNKVILKCLILAVIDLMLLNFAPAILSRRLAELKVSKQLYGVFFALPFVFPIVSALIVVRVMEKIDNHVLL